MYVYIYTYINMYIFFIHLYIYLHVYNISTYNQYVELIRKIINKKANVVNNMQK